MSKLSDWIEKWFGLGTADDWRNPFWRIGEYLRVTPQWSLCLLDLRLGYFKTHKPLASSNFYNGVFTFNFYLTKARGLPILFPRFNLAIRFSHPFYFAWGWGWLWDRGELGFTGPWIFDYESQLEHNPGCIAPGWEEGAI